MNCGIIRDLLPLYHDGVCSPESRAEVEEHLKNCPECRRVLEAVDGPLPEVEKAAADDAEAVRRLSGAWRKGRRLAGILGGIAVLTVCAAIAGGLWFLTAWTVVPMGGADYTLEPYRLEGGSVGVHWDFREGKETWYALEFREEEDGLHYYLERPILRIRLFRSDYNQDGDALFDSGLKDDAEAVYFGLGEDSVLLWKEGEEAELPAATDAQENKWAAAESPPQEVP